MEIDLDRVGSGEDLASLIAIAQERIAASAARAASPPQLPVVYESHPEDEAFRGESRGPRRFASTLPSRQTTSAFAA